MIKKIALWLGLVALLVGAPAQAQEDSEGGVKLTVLIDPMLLFWPLGQVTAELKVHPLLGVAVVGGYGQVTSERNTSGFTSVPVIQSVMRAGGQVNAYLWGNFASGSHLGVEVVHQRFGDGDDGVTKATNNTQLGLYGGYKYTHMLSPTLGLTGLLQAGYSFEVQTSRTVTSSSVTVFRFGLPSDALLNLKLGVTF